MLVVVVCMGFDDCTMFNHLLAEADPDSNDAIQDGDERCGNVDFWLVGDDELRQRDKVVDGNDVLLGRRGLLVGRLLGLLASLSLQTATGLWDFLGIPRLGEVSGRASIGSGCRCKPRSNRVGVLFVLSVRAEQWGGQHLLLLCVLFRSVSTIPWTAGTKEGRKDKPPAEQAYALGKGKAQIKRKGKSRWKQEKVQPF